MSSSTDAVPGQERLVDQAYRQIRDAIVAVRLAGAPLDEKALSASLGLGLTPIRDALKRLTLERVAVTYPRRGTFVSRINITDEARLTEIRVALEGLAAALAAERATESDRTVLAALLDDLEGGSHERAAHTELDARVHRAIYAAARNEFLEATLTSTPTWRCASGTSSCRRTSRSTRPSTASARSSRPSCGGTRPPHGRPPNSTSGGSPRRCVDGSWRQRA